MDEILYISNISGLNGSCFILGYGSTIRGLFQVVGNTGARFCTGMHDSQMDLGMDIHIDVE